MCFPILLNNNIDYEGAGIQTFLSLLQVREFSITDVQPYSIQLVWQDESGQEADMEVFPKNHQVTYPSSLLNILITLSGV